jgi:hypothetical protein
MSYRNLPARRTKAAAIAAVLISLFTLGGLYYELDDWNLIRVQRSKSLGNAVIHAIRDYRTDSGRYPENLNQLVPKYLKVIPTPIAGVGEWHYFTCEDGSAFALEFSGSRQRTCEYSGEMGWWRND